MSLPKVVSGDEWVAAWKALLVKEKELTRQRDALNTERRMLPMVKIDKEYGFDGPEGKRTLADLFDGRRQLIVRHFMFDPSWDEGCPSCTAGADEISDGLLRHLAARDTSFAVISRAPLAKIEGYKAKRGWTFPWYSSFGSDFNYDFHVTLDESVAPIEYNYRTKAEFEQRGEAGFLVPGESSEQPGQSCFLRVDGDVFHTYSSFARGAEATGGSYYFLDETALGRQEDWEEPKGRTDDAARRGTRLLELKRRSEDGAMSSGGFSKGRLEQLHDVMAGYVERAELPGLVSSVSRRGQTHVDAIGSKAMSGRDPMTRDTIFRIASMTKPVTAVAALILVEECTLRLDEPVDELLPELANRRVVKSLGSPLDDTVPAHRSITLRDLLTFRLGYGVVAEPPGLYPVQDAVYELELQGIPGGITPPPPDEWMRRLGTLPLMHQPGEKWMYNTGSEVLGVLIARASGQTFSAFLRERIFEPLGMRDTGFDVPRSEIDRLATSYTTDPDTAALVLHDEPNGTWSHPPAFPSGAGGLVSTVDDFLVFSQMLANAGTHHGERILSRPSIETMTTDQLTPEQKAGSGLVPGWFDSHGWGFGVGVVTRRIDPSEPVGQYGWDGGLGTAWRVDPSEEMITILMTQKALTSPDPPNVFRDFWTAAYAALDD